MKCATQQRHHDRDVITISASGTLKWYTWSYVARRQENRPWRQASLRTTILTKAQSNHDLPLPNFKVKQPTKII